MGKEGKQEATDGRLGGGGQARMYRAFQHSSRLTLLVYILAPKITSFITLGELFDFDVLQFPHL